MPRSTAAPPALPVQDPGPMPDGASPSPMRLRLQNAVASAALVALASLAYSAAPWHAEQMRQVHLAGTFAFYGREFLFSAAALYALLVAAWFLAERVPQPGKSLRLIGMLRRFASAPRAAWATGWQPGERLALLTTLLKAFFGPLMVMSLMNFCLAAWHNGHGLLAAGAQGMGLRGLFDGFGFWFLLQLILFVDVAIFTAGYLVESRRLGSEIRSVDATLLGWAAALLCYPPFNTYTAMILGAQHNDFPRFENTTVHLLANGALLALMAVYASASVALGLKASNLTHRGIVARGPYAWVRHPAYVCKNLAWWIGSVPLVAAAFTKGTVSGILAIASVLGWTLLYVLRALTEEDHLRQVDGEYAAYAERVRYRFVPGVV